MSIGITHPDSKRDEAEEREVQTFSFEHDTLAFANELIWEYCFDKETQRTKFGRRHPKPTYAHRCFVLTRTTRQFFYHARYVPGQAPDDTDSCRRLIRQVIGRDPRTPCAEENRIVIRGYANLRQFSAAREQMLKSTCGGAWRSYVLPSHWRMVFPLSRAHQIRTAEQMAERIRRNEPPIIHLVLFPKLSINHSMVLFRVDETHAGFSFQAYDPNDSSRPAELSFDRTARTFTLPANRYWAGGSLNVIEIYSGGLL